MSRRPTLLASVLTVLLTVPALADEVPASDLPSQLAELKARVEKLESAPAKATQSAYNPAMGAAVDLAFHDANDKANFDFRAIELSIESPVDPYLKAWGVITGSNAGFDVEEAVMETTALPWNLTARGGRLFADFGRLAHFHDHELPVIDRPRSLDSYVGGETRADGVELSYLFPTDLFVRATAGAYDKLGAENKRQDPAGERALDEFTYLGRLAAYFELADAHSLEVGADAAWTPKRTLEPKAGGDAVHRDTWRTLAGVDLTYRYQPPAGGLYKGVVWGTEVLQNDEARVDSATNLPTRRRPSYAGYSFVEVKSGLHWRGGVMLDLTEDLDSDRKLVKTVTPFLTYDVTEFQRLRATYAESWSNAPGPKEHRVGLQWTAVFGKHVHGFRDR